MAQALPRLQLPLARVLLSGHLLRMRSTPEAGTPQGGVISPLLANVYLHEVLDEWFVKEVQPRLQGRALIIRYADDFVLVFERERDARRVFAVLPRRFSKYGLMLHPEKTRLLSFRHPTRAARDRGAPPPSTFDFLGLTHYWGLSLKGRWYVKRKTAKDRFSRALRRVRVWCRAHMHDPIRKQWQALRGKLSGHYAYYGVTSNYDALRRFLWEVRRIWWKWLSRRSNKAERAWAGLVRLTERFPLPSPRIRPPAVT